MPLPGQLRRQVPRRLGRPAQRGPRVTALVWLDQRQQRRDQARVTVSQPLAARAPGPPPPRGPAPPHPPHPRPGPPPPPPPPPAAPPGECRRTPPPAPRPPTPAAAAARP